METNINFRILRYNLNIYIIGNYIDLKRAKAQCVKIQIMNFSQEKPPNYQETVEKKQQKPSARQQYFNEDRNGDDEVDEVEYYYGEEEGTELSNMAAVRRIIDHEKYIQKQIELNYPTRYVVIDSVIMIVLNIVLIVLQIIATRNNAALSYLSSAVWAALYNLLVVGMLLFTLKMRSSTLIMLTSTMKLFGMIISFVGFVLINLVAFYHYNCQAVSYYRPCYNRDMKPVHYAIIGVGVPCMISSMAVFVYFQFKLLARHKFIGIAASENMSTGRPIYNNQQNSLDRNTIAVLM